LGPQDRGGTTADLNVSVANGVGFGLGADLRAIQTEEQASAARAGLLEFMTAEVGDDIALQGIVKALSGAGLVTNVAIIRSLASDQRPAVAELERASVFSQTLQELAELRQDLRVAHDQLYAR
jgi:hypothetical protein